MATKGVYVSPGLYRNPNGGLYRSTSGVLPQQKQAQAPVAGALPGGNKTPRPMNTPMGGNKTPRPMGDPSGNVPFPGMGGSTGTTTTTDTTTTASNTTPTVTDPNAGSTGSNQVSKIMEQLFPGMTAWDSSTYQASPMYQWQMNQGKKLLDAKLASQGLNNSGTELGAYNELSSRVGAQESERLAGLQQTQADRLAQILDNNANRDLQQTNSNRDFYINALNLAQQNNPMQYISQALSNTSNLTVDQAKELSRYIADQYQRVMGGGGASAGSPPQYSGSLPSGPDYSGINAIASMMGGQNSGGFANNILNSLPGLIKGIKSFF